MYRREKPMALKSSSSAICNNLSIQVNMERSMINYAVVHKAVINLVGAFMDGSTVNHRQVVCKEPSAAHANSMIMQTRLLPFPGRTILVIASQKGIQMFEADTSVMLYWYAIDESSGHSHATFARGICQVQNDTICVGNHQGHILVFDIPTRGTNITLSETLKSHNAAVCDLQSVEQRMVSSDDTGNIILWEAGGEKCKQILKIQGSANGFPCSAVGMFKDVIIGAFGSGHIRLFSASTGRMQVEVAAHARWITAMDIAPLNGYIITASEDTYVRVWRVEGGDNPSMEMKYADCVSDLQLQGAKFITKDGRAFGLTGYDNNEIIFYKQS